MTLPILYSLRHCPFAMRARLAIFRSGQAIELRDVVLTNKPASMLRASPKGTVPILVVSADLIIDESLDVMLWSLGQSDPHDLLLQQKNDHNDTPLHGLTAQQRLSEILAFIKVYDSEFKGCIERYKCAKRYHESNLIELREACEVYIQDLETRLAKHEFVFGKHESLADIAIFPFIRQFAKVERQWYVQSPYENLKRWLNAYLQSAMFNKVMAPNDIWEEGTKGIVFQGQ